MSMNDDMVMASSDSFWELGKFMKTVKRCENGNKLCDSLRQLVEQRSEIEKKYSKELIGWNKKWNAFLDNGSEYGTIQGAWRGLLMEGESLSELHTVMADRLMSEVYQSIKHWQKENYHKSMMHYKETKEFEDNFRKVQKPWGKKLTKMLAAKKDYHNMCRQEKSTAHQENNYRGDPSVSADQLKKLQEKLRKLQDEVNNTREKYQASLNDLNSYNAKYMEDMTEVYNRCQVFEKQRIDFFKKTLFQMHDCLDLSVEARYGKIYTDLHSTVGKTDPDKDLKYWSLNNGVDMPMNWPTFEEYSPELQSISSRKQKSQLGSDGITITRIKHNRESSYENYGSDHNNPPSYNSTVPPSQTQPVAQTNDAPRTVSSATATHVPRQSYDQSLNPFGSEDEDDGDNDDRSDDIDDKSRVDNECVKEITTSVKVVPPTKKTRNNIPTPVKVPRNTRVENEKNDVHPVPADRPVSAAILEDAPKENNSSTVSPAPTNDDYNNGGAANPFGEAGSDDEHSVEEDPMTARGVAVKAVYDYVKTEDDEFSFKTGETFVRLTEEDEMGWCKGRKDGEIGLFPANYVVPL